MEPIVLFIIPGACSLGSMIALEWLNIPYQIGITTAEIRASTNFRKINPTGKVGALKDGNMVVGENLAILLYLADKYPNHIMCPAIGSNKRANVYQWLSYISSTLHPAFGQVLFPTRFISESHVEEFKNLALKRLSLSLQYIEEQLLPSGLFIDDKPTIVDAQAYGILRWAGGFKGGAPIVEINHYSKISNFLNLMATESAVKNALALEFQQTSKLINSKFSGFYIF
jgi:glutathione S-transferase